MTRSPHRKPITKADKAPKARTAVLLKLPPDLVDDYEALAAAQTRSRANMMEVALKEYLAAQAKRAA